MTIVNICGACRGFRDPSMNRCFQFFPCLADPGALFPLLLLLLHLFVVLISPYYFGISYLNFGVLRLARRSALSLKVALVAVHFVYAALIFLFDDALIEKTKKEPWYAYAFSFCLHFIHCNSIVILLVLYKFKSQLVTVHCEALRRS